MGSSSSTLKRNESTPSMAYGRLRIHASPRISSPGALASRRNLSAGNLAKSASVNGIHALSERGPTEHSRLLAIAPPVRIGVAELKETESMAMPSPALAVWIVPALLCAMSYAFYNIFIKKGSATIHPVLGGVILQFVAAILGVLLLSFIVIREGGTEDLNYDWDGIQWSICAGIAVGLAEMISFFVSSLGVQAMQSIPIIIGGSVMFGTLLGLILLGEMLTMQGWIGVAMLVAGICLVGTDPAATGLH